MIFKTLIHLIFTVLICFQLCKAQTHIDDPNIQVGVYYFGGWQHFPNLRLKDVSPSPGSYLMDSFPNRKPLKGWFDDRKSIIDDEIRDAVKYGISFFAFLWYYPEALTPERNKLNAPLNYYLRSKVSKKKQLKFCIVYTNHNHSTGFGITSESDWRRYTDYWIGLMKRRDYLRVSFIGADVEKPLFIIWNPGDFHEQWNSFPGGAKAILDGFRNKAKTKGLLGINIAGCWEQTVSKQTFALDGYDIITGYNFNGAGDIKAGEAGHYDTFTVAHQPIWNSMTTLGKPIIPVITSGWDPRPNPGILKVSPFYPDRSPQKFIHFCQLTKGWVSQHENNIVKPKTILIYAWNELGEGGYILPTVGDGFGYLDAVKEVFGKTESTKR